MTPAFSELFVKIKADFDKKMKNGVNQAVISSLTTQTVNLVPSDWQKRILADNLTSAAQHSAKIAIMTDYLGQEKVRMRKKERQRIPTVKVNFC